MRSGTERRSLKAASVHAIQKPGEIVGGADYWAMVWGKMNGVPVNTMRADWKRHRLRRWSDQEWSDGGDEAGRLRGHAWRQRVFHGRLCASSRGCRNLGSPYEPKSLLCSESRPYSEKIFGAREGFFGAGTGALAKEKAFATEVDLCARFIAALPEEWINFNEAESAVGTYCSCESRECGRLPDRHPSQAAAERATSSHRPLRITIRGRLRRTGPDCRAVLVPMTEAGGFACDLRLHRHHRHPGAGAEQ
jgi:hypothetical protein